MKVDISKQVAELKQENEITERLINHIFFSKRLLADHVESLEQCLMQNSLPVKPLEIFTARNTCVLLGSTILEHFITPRSLKFTLIPSLIITGGFSALYLVKNMFMFRNKVVEAELEKLVRSIDDFGNCIRRNITYFNEVLVMKTSELVESRQIERAWDCITSVKDVVEILFEATRKLETNYPIPARFSEYYSPMEELKECDYFKTNITDYNPKNIKDFYNIFAYVQSQYLFRLALTLSQKPSLSTLSQGLSRVDSQIRQLVMEEEIHFKNLSIELRKKKQLEANELNQTKTMQNKSGPVAVLQDSSLRLNACMVAVAEECQQLDEVLQGLNETGAEHNDDNQVLIEVANSMRSIESALSVCFDDFHRLMLVYNKFLSSKLDNRLVEDVDKSASSEALAEGNESILRVEISHDNATADGEKKDDFYAYMFEENSPPDTEEEKSVSADMEILNFEKRITKSKFKPVLKQLKDRIDPIRKEMLEKERKILQAKGIDVDALFVADKDLSRPEKPDDSDDSDDDEIGVECRRKQKVRDNFAEMRNFLAQKEAFNLSQFKLPNQVAAADEEILE